MQAFSAFCPFHVEKRQVVDVHIGFHGPIHISPKSVGAGQDDSSFSSNCDKLLLGHTPIWRDFRVIEWLFYVSKYLISVARAALPTRVRLPQVSQVQHHQETVLEGIEVHKPICVLRKKVAAMP